jgi:hypothetical protein
MINKRKMKLRSRYFTAFFEFRNRLSIKNLEVNIRMNNYKTVSDKEFEAAKQHYSEARTATAHYQAEAFQVFVDYYLYSASGNDRFAQADAAAAIRHALNGAEKFSHYPGVPQETAEKIYRLFGQFITRLANSDIDKCDFFKNEVAAEKQQTQRRQWESQGLCRYCGGTLKGVFGKKCVSCGKKI